MPIPAGSVMQMTWLGTCFNQNIRHVRNFRLVSGGTGGGNLLDYANTFIGQVSVGGANDLTLKYLDCLSNSYSLKEYRAQIVFPTRGAYAYLDPAVQPPGSRAVAGAANSQGSIEASTALAGRQEVAVYKIGPMANGDMDGGKVTPALRTLLGTYATTFWADLTVVGANAGVWRPCIYHRREAPLTSSASDIVDAAARESVRVKSTRTIGRGE